MTKEEKIAEQIEKFGKTFPDAAKAVMGKAWPPPPSVLKKILQTLINMGVKASPSDMFTLQERLDISLQAYGHEMRAPD